MSTKITQVHHYSDHELIDAFLIGLEKRMIAFEKKFKPKEPTQWLTKKEVASILSISLVTVDDWSKKGILSPFRIGNRIRFQRKSVEQALIQIND